MQQKKDRSEQLNRAVDGL